MTFLKLFISTMISNVKFQNIFYLIIVSSFIEHGQCIQENNLIKISLSVSYIFSKFDGSDEFSVTFLLGPPNCTREIFLSKSKN
jgi:hypothetical protein